MVMSTRMRFLLLSVVCLSFACVSVAQHSPETAVQHKTVQERLGYTVTARLLVIHADDLGMNHSVNHATFEALEKGWITSASILVPCPWFPEVARWAKQNPDIDLGIHLALNSEWTDLRWGPVSGASKVPSLLDEHGYLPPETPAVAQNAKLADVDYELRAQIDRAQKAGIRITHLDTHMAALMATPELFGVYRKLGEEFHVPILFERTGTHSPQGIPVPADALVERVVTMEPGVAPNNKDWLDWYKKQLTPLPPGVYQLIVHLAYDNEEMQGATWDHPDWGAAWRQRDLEMVKSAEFRQFLKEQGFVLVTWKELAKVRQQ
jgi:chitin disaccharide deacetylase